MALGKYTFGFRGPVCSYIDFTTHDTIVQSVVAATGASDGSWRFVYISEGGANCNAHTMDIYDRLGVPDGKGGIIHIRTANIAHPCQQIDYTAGAYKPKQIAANIASANGWGTNTTSTLPAAGTATPGLVGVPTTTTGSPAVGTATPGLIGVPAQPSTPTLTILLHPSGVELNWVMFYKFLYQKMVPAQDGQPIFEAGDQWYDPYQRWFWATYPQYPHFVIDAPADPTIVKKEYGGLPPGVTEKPLSVDEIIARLDSIQQQLDSFGQDTALIQLPDPDISGVIKQLSDFARTLQSLLAAVGGTSDQLVFLPDVLDQLRVIFAPLFDLNDQQLADLLQQLANNPDLQPNLHDQIGSIVNLTAEEPAPPAHYAYDDTFDTGGQISGDQTVNDQLPSVVDSVELSNQLTEAIQNPEPTAETPLSTVDQQQSCTQTQDGTIVDFNPKCQTP